MTLARYGVRVGVMVFAAAVMAWLVAGETEAGLNAWTSGGPEGGLIRSVVVDPQTSDVVYALAVDGGVFKSTTGGSFWTPIDNGLTTLNAQAFAIDPKTPIVLYAGTGRGLFKSTNGGVSWLPANNGLLLPNGGGAFAVFSIAIDPNTTTTLYVGTAQGGIFKSTNGGTSWGQVFLTPTAPVFALTIDPVATSTLYAGTLDDGVFKSVDAGASWSRINTGLSNLVVPAVAVHPGTATVYAATFGGGVFKSLNGGANWTPANAGLPVTPGTSSVETVTVSVERQTPSTLYAGTLAAGVFKSTNGGGSWFPVNANLPENAFATVVAVDPRAPATLYGGLFGNGVFKSTNGGATWTASNAGLGASFMLAVAGERNSPATLYAGTYRQKLYKSTNGGVSWRESSTGITDGTVNAVAVSPPSLFNVFGVPATVYAGTSQHSVFVSAGSLGSQGSRIIGPPGAGGVFKSTDGGATWSRSLTTPTAVQALAVDPLTPLTVYAGTLGNGILKSTNGGTVWTPANTGLTDLYVYSLAIDPNSPSVLYAGFGEAGRGPVFKSTNGGVTWNPTGLLAQQPVVALAIDSQLSSTLYAATWGDGVYKSVNGGASWTPINSGLFNSAGSFITVFTLAVDPQQTATVYAGSFDNGVFKSTNGGANWARSNSGLPPSSVVHALNINPSGGCLQAGTGGSVYAFATQPSAECPSPPTLAAVLSSTSQSVPVGGVARTVATIRNLAGTSSASTPGDASASVLGEKCGITQLTGAPTNFTFQAVDATTTQPTAPINMPIDIVAGSSQAFQMTLTPTDAFCPLDIQFGFNCSNAQVAPVITGVNTLGLSAGATNGTLCGLSASVSVSQPSFVVGQTLIAGGSIANPGLPGTAADFYAGIFYRPDGSIQFFTSTGIVLGHVDNLASFRPIAVNVPLSSPFSVSQSDFHRRQWTEGDLRGQYVFFVAAVKAGALAGGTIAPDQILRLATALYSFP